MIKKQMSAKKCLILGDYTVGVFIERTVVKR